MPLARTVDELRLTLARETSLEDFRRSIETYTGNGITCTFPDETTVMLVSPRRQELRIRCPVTADDFFRSCHVFGRLIAGEPEEGPPYVRRHTGNEAHVDLVTQIVVALRQKCCAEGLCQLRLPQDDRERRRLRMPEAQWTQDLVIHYLADMITDEWDPPATAEPPEPTEPTILAEEEVDHAVVERDFQEALEEGDDDEYPDIPTYNPREVG